MRILVTDGMDKTAMAELKAQGHEVVEQFYESEELGKALRDFDVVVVRSKTKVRAPHIDEAKGSNLKLIIRPSGTEPKIKIYYTTLGKDLAEAQAEKDKLSEALKPIMK